MERTVVYDFGIPEVTTPTLCFFRVDLEFFGETYTRGVQICGLRVWHRFLKFKSGRRGKKTPPTIPV